MTLLTTKEDIIMRTEELTFMGYQYIRSDRVEFFDKDMPLSGFQQLWDNGYEEVNRKNGKLIYAKPANIVILFEITDNGRKFKKKGYFRNDVLRFYGGQNLSMQKATKFIAEVLNGEFIFTYYGNGKFSVRRAECDT